MIVAWGGFPNSLWAAVAPCLSRIYRLFRGKCERVASPSWKKRCDLHTKALKKKNAHNCNAKVVLSGKTKWMRRLGGGLRISAVKAEYKGSE